ncbi:MAG: precorrin-6y C5,15-methyltransferase (decarboxylating) subunit CbiE [Alkaliphilus sp.]|nr:precorrin-6y C5,15-methyltransferase (decarboxylating) subunit CbiE [Alkaliphilus sp.]
MNKLFILGMGPGNKDYVLPVTTLAINSCDVLVGGVRHLKEYETLGKTMIPLDKDIDRVMELIRENIKDKRVALLLSGDTGFYSMLKYLRKEFKPEELEVIPGISSFQYLAARIGETWQDAYVGSLHGRVLDLEPLLRKHSRIYLLTDSNNSPQQIAKKIIGYGVKKITMVVGENLSYENERIIEATPQEIIEQLNFEMAVVVIKVEVEL